MYDHLVTSSLGAISPEPYATGTLADLVPEVRVKVEALLAEATQRGFKPKIRSVGRTCEQQAEQVKLGFSQAGLCRSMHTLGHAIDLDLSPNACSTYTALGEWWEKQGGVWGGRWKGAQFGDCGDAGHYHWGFNKAQAVPTSICPADVTLEQCRALRTEYLTKAHAASSGSSERGYNLLAVGTFVVIGVLAAVAYFAQARTTTKSNPTVGTKKFKEYELQAFEASYKNEWDVDAYLPNQELVGKATFAGVRDYEVEDEDGFPKLIGLKGWQVDVAPTHRRKGLAAAMYQFAEEAFGLPVRPGDFQTPEGKMFLEGR